MQCIRSHQRMRTSQPYLRFCPRSALYMQLQLPNVPWQLCTSLWECRWHFETSKICRNRGLTPRLVVSCCISLSNIQLQPSLQRQKRSRASQTSRLCWSGYQKMVFSHQHIRAARCTNTTLFSMNLSISNLALQQVTSDNVAPFEALFLIPNRQSQRCQEPRRSRGGRYGSEFGC